MPRTSEVPICRIRREAVVFSLLEEIRPRRPPRIGGCVWAREAAVSPWRTMGAVLVGVEIVLDCASCPCVLYGRATLWVAPPPRSGFLFARGDGATTPAAKRRLCAGARIGCFVWAHQGAKPFSDFARIPSVFRGRVGLWCRSPPRSGGFSVARREGDEISAANRRLYLRVPSSGSHGCMMARGIVTFAHFWRPNVFEQLCSSRIFCLRWFALQPKIGFRNSRRKAAVASNVGSVFFFSADVAFRRAKWWPRFGSESASEGAHIPLYGAIRSIRMLK